MLQHIPLMEMMWKMGVANSVVVSATDLLGQLTVSDTSDDGLIGGGDTGADPTLSLQHLV